MSLIQIFVNKNMTRSLTFIQNCLVSIFVFGFVFASVYIPQPLNKIPQAEAVLALEATQVVVLGTLTATFALQNSLVHKELYADGIFYVLAKAIVTTITQSIVRWINNGFEGSPAFVRDLKETLINVADDAFGYYLVELGGPLSFVCSPFQLDVQIALASSYELRRDGYPVGGVCSLTGALANIENFISNDFSDGGWEAWFQIVNKPEIYTPYGSYLEADAQANRRIAEAQRNQTTELSWGKGFMSKKECVDSLSGGGPVCKIVTPGDTIAESLNKHLFVGTKGLVEADEINEIIGALIGYLAQTVITGVGGLFGVEASASGPGAWSPPTGGGTIDPGGGGGPQGSPFDQIFGLVSESQQNHQTWMTSVIPFYETRLTERANDAGLSLEEREEARLEANRINQEILPQISDNLDALTDLYDEILGYINVPPASTPAALDSVTREYNSLSSQLYTANDINIFIGIWRSILGIE